MAGNWGAALAALAGGAGSLANSMDTRAQEAESKRQRQLAEALKMLEVKDIYGGTDVPEGTSPSDAMTGLAVTQLNRMAPPGIQQAGGGSSMMPQITSPSYTGQRDEQLSYGAPSVQDIGGKRILFDPSMGKEARTERRMLKIADTKDKALQSREAVKSVRDFAEAMELAKVQAGLKPQPTHALTWRDNVQGADGKVYQVGYDANGKEVQRVPQYVKPESGQPNYRDFQREQGLQGRYQQNPTVKDAYGVANAVAGIRAAATGDSPQNDLAMIYALVKFLDPNSAVREGEIDLARAARSVGTQVVGAWQKAKGGNLLTAQERKNILRLLESRVLGARQRLAPIQKDFGRMAGKFGADSSYVAPDPFGENGVTTPAGNPYRKARP